MSNHELEVTEENKQVQISEVNGRTQIVFKRAHLKGKVTRESVLNTLLIAAQLQGEYYIKKLSRGSPLDPGEVKALKELAEITKLEIPQQESKKIEDSTPLEAIKSALYLKLEEKLRE